MALDCHFAEALCLGIGAYQHDQCLPQAAADAENMATAFRDLGCCNVTFETNQEMLTRQKVVELVSAFVQRAKLQMQEAKTARLPLLVAVFVASHGIHAHGKELPLVVPSDRTCSSETKQLVDLNELLLNELTQVRLPRTNRRPCCIWIIMDTCRSGPITSWQARSDCKRIERSADSAGYRGPYSCQTDLTPDFLFVLACDPGGWASDSNSLSSILVKSLEQDGVSIRDACEGAIEVVQQASRGHQRPWMIQRGGKIFSQIRTKPPQVQPEVVDPLEAECVPHWVQVAFARILGLTTALLFLLCFFGLSFSLKILVERAEHVVRGEACPSNSCFCTDCHHRDINSNDSRDPPRFNCQLWDEGFTLNRCRIARFLQVTKISLALVISRKSWCWLLGLVPREGATPLDLCVILIAVVNVLTSLQLPLQDEDYSTVIAFSYGINDFAFISASISMLVLVHTEFRRVLRWSRGPIVSNFTAFFLVTALIGQGMIFAWSHAIELISAEHTTKRQVLFYAFHVFTGATTAAVGFTLSRGNEGPVARKSFELLCVSLCWMVVVLAWLITSHWDKELMAQSDLVFVVAERACSFWKLRLMVWFSEHSIRGRFPGAAPCRMRAAKVARAIIVSPRERASPG
ncbi:unnamed protein product [Effrenium voratum]|nr:unnamed protein product [Effrenium voratum]